MRDDLSLLPLKITSEDGKDYVVSLWQPTIQQLATTWARYSNYRVLFSDFTVGNFETFASMVLGVSTVVLQVDCEDKEVGLLYGTEIRPCSSALAHYVFWDRKPQGRQRLILTILRYMMDELMLHRINISIPIFAYSALHRVHKMGLRIEGRRQQAILHKGFWKDVLEFGVLRSELTDQVIQDARITEQSDSQHHWHGLLKDDEKLARKILRLRNGNGPENEGNRSSSKLATATAGHVGSSGNAEELPYTGAESTVHNTRDNISIPAAV